MQANMRQVVSLLSKVGLVIICYDLVEIACVMQFFTTKKKFY
jgi:hypothetical protein